MLCTHPCIFTIINKPTNQSMNILFFYSVPQPDVNVNINQNTPLYAGSILTLTCTVTLDFYVDESGSIIVAMEWSNLRNISGNRYSITSTLNSGNIYTSNLTISHLETQDSGIYTCSVTISGGDYVHQADASSSISITVDQKNITGV